MSQKQLLDILWDHCPAKAKHGFTGAIDNPAFGGCPTCSPFRPAMEKAKREGYQVAIRLIEKNPGSAAEVLRTLIEMRPPS